MAEENTQEKYDRQIRLWGVQGQKRLSKSSICLLGCAGAGIEALKNLVLPGCGQIVIVDNTIVKTEHLGISFFLDQSSINKSLAQQTLNFLLEMNLDVKGEAIQKNPSEILNEEFLNKYSLYISNQLSQKQNIILSKICQKLDKPVIFLNTYGFYAYVRNQKLVHEIHEVKQNKKFDLRIREPFSGLLEHSDQFNIQELIKNQEDKKSLDLLVHIPYGILLVKAFKQSPNKTRDEISNIIKNWKKQINHESIQNFEEALRNLMVINMKKQFVYDNLSIVLNHINCIQANEGSKLFWKLSKTLKSYIQKYDNYPQSQDLPDMHASTDAYINLKNVYKQQNHRTKELFKKIFAQLFPQSSYENIEIDTFIENIMSLSIVQMRPFYKELQSPSFSFEGDWPQVYNALRAADHFKQKHNRVATSSDFEQVKELVSQILKGYNSQDIMMTCENIIKEVCRAQGSEMISISSIAGSVAAQEAIKLITHLFTPMNSGYFFDGTKTQGYMTEC